MKILIYSNHQFPAYPVTGYGMMPVQRKCGAIQHVNDLLAKGLSELGHQVYYYLSSVDSQEMLPGVEWVSKPVSSADIFHGLPSETHPWIMAMHGLGKRQQKPVPEKNWVYVSQAICDLVGGNDRVVHNGIDPDDFIYSKEKEDYFLYMADMGEGKFAQYLHKGLDTALSLALEMDFRLIVAGGSKSSEVIGQVKKACREYGVEYVGDVRGTQKAKLLSGARAFLHPSKFFEGFGLTAVEALMSGTPVIARDIGALPEIVSPDVGFLCTTQDDFRNAITHIDEVKPERCRKRAIEHFHYLRMAQGYVDEYRKESANFRESPK